MGREIDIRHVDSDEKISVIRFSDVDYNEYNADVLIRDSDNECVYVEDSDNSTSETSATLNSKEQALNLIKAIEKAIDLGWFDENQ